MSNQIELDINAQAQTIMYFLTGRIPCETIHKLNHVVNELKKNLEHVNQHLEGKEYLVGNHVTLADIQLAATIVYPLALAMNPQWRNKVLNLMNWFYRITALDGHFEATFGKVKLGTKVLKVPEAPKKKEEPKKDVKKDAKKEVKKEKKPEENKVELPPTKIVLDDFKRFLLNSKDKKADLDNWMKTDFEPENWSIWHFKYDIYKNEGAQLHVTSNLSSGFIERAEACRRGAFGLHCVLGEEPNLEIEGVWLWRGQEIMPEMNDHPQFEYYKTRKLDHTKAEDSTLITDFWTGAEGDLMNGKKCQRKTHM
jgi:elongation factor 1-gamma